MIKQIVAVVLLTLVSSSSMALSENDKKLYVFCQMVDHIITEYEWTFINRKPWLEMLEVYNKDMSSLEKMRLERISNMMKRDYVDTFKPLLDSFSPSIPKDHLKYIVFGRMMSHGDGATAKHFYQCYGE
jgi:hypothetical protein